MLSKNDIEVKEYERKNAVDGISIDRFERHLADIYKSMQKLKIVIKNRSDFYKEGEKLRTITFYYFKGF